MTQSWILVGAFLGVLVCLPMLLKWLKQRVPGRFADVSGQSRFISALAVGPHQRVVTVEVGPEGKRVWLTLGVTGQTISCLHTVEVDGSAVVGSAGQSQPDEGRLSAVFGSSANKSGSMV
jgi:flagellar protein FliO/FliZ